MVVGAKARSTRAYGGPGLVAVVVAVLGGNSVSRRLVSVARTVSGGSRSYAARAFIRLRIWGVSLGGYIQCQSVLGRIGGGGEGPSTFAWRRTNAGCEAASVIVAESVAMAIVRLMRGRRWCVVARWWSGLAIILGHMCMVGDALNRHKGHLKSEVTHTQVSRIKSCFSTIKDISPKSYF